MPDDIHISDVRFIASPPASAETGLLGFVSFVVNKTFHVNGVAVRRTLEGKPVLSFPAREGRHGQRFFFLRPVDDRARIAVEHKVLSALGLVRSAS